MGDGVGDRLGVSVTVGVVDGEWVKTALEDGCGEGELSDAEMLHAATLRKRKMEATSGCKGFIDDLTTRKLIPIR